MSFIWIIMGRLRFFMKLTFCFVRPLQHTVLGALTSCLSGGHLPFEAAPCVAVVRAVMDSTGWTHAAASAAAGDTGSGLQSGGGSGLLLVHVTAGYGLAHATVLECLSAGCCGVMASLCEESEPGGRGGQKGVKSSWELTERSLFRPRCRQTSRSPLLIRLAILLS